MQELRANTQVKVIIGPAVAVGDGFTPVTTLDLSTADEAELFKHDAAGVTSIAAATFAAIANADGYYNLTITAALSDTEGLLTVTINDDSLILPIIARFMVLSEAAWDSKYIAKDDGFMDVNIKTVGRADTNETAANNAEAFFDGTGYAGTNNVIPTVTTLTGHTAQTGDSFAIVNSGTHGNAALKTLIDTLDNILDTEFPALVTTIGTPAGASVSADILVLDNLVDDLESRLTAVRAGYLDNLSAGAAALESTAQTILTDTNELQVDWTNGGRLDLLIDAILADTDSLDTTKITTARAAVLTDWIDGGRLDLILDARASQTSVDTIDDLLDSEFPALTTTVGALFTTALTESYRAAGAAPTMAQIGFELLAGIGDFAISSTTKTLRKINATTAKTFTLDSASAPTSITEAT